VAKKDCRGIGSLLGDELAKLPEGRHGGTQTTRPETAQFRGICLPLADSSLTVTAVLVRPDFIAAGPEVTSEFLVAQGVLTQPVGELNDSSRLTLRRPPVIVNSDPPRVDEGVVDAAGAAHR
jgi:hypothetical protein